MYAPNLISTERDEAKKFLDGLRKAIRDRIAHFMIEEYPEAIVGKRTTWARLAQVT